MYTRSQNRPSANIGIEQKPLLLQNFDIEAATAMAFGITRSNFHVVEIGMMPNCIGRSAR